MPCHVIACYDMAWHDMAWLRLWLWLWLWQWLWHSMCHIITWLVEREGSFAPPPCAPLPLRMSVVSACASCADKATRTLGAPSVAR